MRPNNRQPCSRFFDTGRCGSVCLEAAILLPVILLLSWFMLSQIIAVTAEIKLSGAVRRTAAELSLLSPAARLLEKEGLSGFQEIPSLNSELEDVASALSAMGLSGQLLQDLLLDGGTSLLAGPLILERIRYWLDDAACGQPGQAGPFSHLWRHTIEDMQVYLNWQPDQQQLWIGLGWQQRHALGKRQQSLQRVVPLWTGHNASAATDKTTDDAIWMLDNFTRGQTFRSLLGANLPYDFPVIASFSGGTATSIKSMDLTAPSYAGSAALVSQAGAFIAEVARFNGAMYDKGGTAVSIGAADITSRHLILVIPQNSDREWLESSLAQLSVQAAGQGVILQVVRRGNSSRYQTPQQNAPS